MKIVIVGTGGVGGYFGAKLAKAGNDVTFIARGEHLKAIKDNGLTIKSVLGDFHIDAVNAMWWIPSPFFSRNFPIGPSGSVDSRSSILVCPTMKKAVLTR